MKRAENGKKNSDSSMNPSSAKPAENGKKNSDGSIHPRLKDTLAYPTEVDRFLKRCRITPIEVFRLRDTVEQRAVIIDNWVEQSIDSKTHFDLLSPEDISTDANSGNNRPTAMSYISVRELIDSIAESENASSIRVYAMNLMAAFRIYQEELVNRLLGSEVFRTSMILFFVQNIRERKFVFKVI